MNDRLNRLRGTEAPLVSTEWQTRIEELLAHLAEHPGRINLPGLPHGGIHGEIPRNPWLDNIGSQGGGLATNDHLVGTGANDRLFGGNGEDVIEGNAGNDRLNGGNGSDSINGGLGNDHLAGGRGDDSLVGGAGDDVLFGGLGNDVLTGGEGSDTYVFRRNGGDDVINNIDAGAQSNDVLKLGPAITLQQLSFQHVGNELVINLVGTDDSITVTGWFANPANRLDGIQLGNGDVLTATQIENLVSTMAAFNPGGISSIAVGEPNGGLNPVFVSDDSTAVRMTGRVFEIAAPGGRW